MYLVMYYFVFHRLNKYLLNKINYTEFEFEFKQKFYSNKYFITILTCTNLNSHYIDTFFNYITISITSQFSLYNVHLTTYIHSTLVFYL